MGGFVTHQSEMGALPGHLNGLAREPVAPLDPFDAQLAHSSLI